LVALSGKARKIVPMIAQGLPSIEHKRLQQTPKSGG